MVPAILALSGLLSLAQSSSLAQVASPVRPVPVGELAPTIDAHFRKFMEDHHVPGLVYGVVRDGRVERIGAMGVRDLETRRPVDGETLFRIASMSKSFTALAILKLRDDGRLSLDAPAETYVPEMRRWRYPTTDSPRIRVRDLLSHVGGFVTDDPWGDRQQPLPDDAFSRLLADGVPFTRPPGTAFEYSNLGYALLGRIVSNVSKRPYKDYIEGALMRPLGMASSGFEITESPRERRALGYRWENDAYAPEPDMKHGSFGAMGGVQTSAVDYARWVAFLLSAWPPRDGPDDGPARRASVRELAQGLNFVQRSPRPGASGASCTQAAAYGMGFRVAQDCDLGLTLGHGGGYPGYGSYVLLVPEHGIGVFALSNRTYSGPTGAVWNVAMELHRAGWLGTTSEQPSHALVETYRVAGAMFAARSVEPGLAWLAENFLLDRSAENWTAEFARIAGDVGACRTDAPLTPTGALSGRFVWTCDRGSVSGNLLLAPTRAPRIQALRLSAVRAARD